MSAGELIAIEELEKKYFKEMLNIFRDEDNIKYIKKNVKEIISRTTVIPRYKPVNILQNPWQELMRFMLSKYAIESKWELALFPASSDMCFETSDCFLNFDVKTVKTTDADAQGRIQTEPNQVSYPGNKIPMRMTRGEHRGKTVVYNGPNFPHEIGKKKTITFFLQSTWDLTNGKEVIADSTLNIIPNGLLGKNYSKNGKYGDLIDSFKDVGEGKCEFCKFQISFTDKEALKELKKHANCSRPSHKELEYCILKKTARFVIDRFKKPLFTSGWSRSEQLPDYN